MYNNRNIMLLSYGVGTKFDDTERTVTCTTLTQTLNTAYWIHIMEHTVSYKRPTRSVLVRKKEVGRRNGEKDSVWYVVSRNVSTRSFITKIKVHPLMVV